MSCNPENPAAASAPSPRAALLRGARRHADARQRVTVFGAGYVGLVSAACLARLGHDVVCVDSDAQRVRDLRRGHVPLHEAQLPDLVAEQARRRRLRFTRDADAAVAHGDIVFIAVGTPGDDGDGHADLRQVDAVARRIADGMTAGRIVVVKSTVPVGTAARLRAAIAARLRERGVALPFALASNPEFLREGCAVRDFLHPDRIVIGADDARALRSLQTLYAPLTRAGVPLCAMDTRSAEFTKYASNAMLAARLSLINELAELAEHVGADIEAVRRGVGADHRLGPHFLAPGCGYGGSCLPKDVRALLCTARDAGQPMPMLEATQRVNARQPCRLVERVAEAVGAALAGRRIAVWGLAFKPDTDDLREAPSLRVIAQLLDSGADVVAYDPVAMPGARRLLDALPGGVTFAADRWRALDDADALVVVTEWPEFRELDTAQLRSRMRRPIVVDGRNLYDAQRLAADGIDYRAVGRPRVRPDAGLARPAMRPAPARMRAQAAG